MTQGIPGPMTADELTKKAKQLLLVGGPVQMLADDIVRLRHRGCTAAFIEEETMRLLARHGELKWQMRHVTQTQLARTFTSATPAGTISSRRTLSRALRRL